MNANGKELVLDFAKLSEYDPHSSAYCERKIPSQSTRGHDVSISVVRGQQSFPKAV